MHNHILIYRIFEFLYSDPLIMLLLLYDYGMVHIVMRLDGIV